MTVTDVLPAVSAAQSRNAALFAEWEAREEERAERNRLNPERAAGLRSIGIALNGGVELDEDEQKARSLARFAKDSSLWCCRCESEFGEGDVVYRRREGAEGFRESGWSVESYCDECVSGWHPSWKENRRKPEPCAGGCGVLVSHWYWFQTIATCSRRCSERVTADRKRVHLDPRECAACGESFTPKRKDARYCSNACRQDAYRHRKAGRS